MALPVKIPQKAIWIAPLAALAGVLALLLLGGHGGKSELLTFAATRGPLTITISATGNIRNQDQTIVRSEVEGKHTIISIVEEGKKVEKGDLLVELDGSNFADEKVQQEIAAINADAAQERARENLEVVKLQSLSDVTKAEQDKAFAEIDIKKYAEGDYPQELRKAQADVELAKEDLERADDKLSWSQKLLDKGYITRSEADSDELAAKRCKINLELAEAKLKGLVEFEHPRKQRELETSLEQNARALERVRRKTSADILQAETDLKVKNSELERQKAKLEKVLGKIAKCRITAPVAGMVVYATSGKPDWRGSSPMAAGRDVVEREEIIYLPTSNAMVADVKLHESNLSKVKLEMSARVIVDAMPNKSFIGKVGKISLLPDAQNAWLNPDLKVYGTEVNVGNEDGSLRPGMNCRADIVVEEYADAIYIPVQSVVEEGGGQAVYVVKDGSTELRRVTTGLDNGQVMRIVSGLVEGENVMMVPPLPQNGPQGQGAESLPGNGNSKEHGKDRPSKGGRAKEGKGEQPKASGQIEAVNTSKDGSSGTSTRAPLPPRPPKK